MTSMLSQMIQAVFLTGGFALLAHMLGPRQALRVNAGLFACIALMLIAFPAAGTRNGLLVELGATTIGQVWAFWVPQAMRTFVRSDVHWPGGAAAVSCCCTRNG